MAKVAIGGTLLRIARRRMPRLVSTFAIPARKDVPYDCTFCDTPDNGNDEPFFSLPCNGAEPLMPRLRMRFVEPLYSFVIAALMIPWASSGKNMDYTPDLASEGYWSSHHIGIGQVSELIPWGDGQTVVGVTVRHTFTEEAQPKSLKFPLSDAWFGQEYSSEKSPLPKIGEHFILYFGREVRPSKRYVITRIDGDPSIDLTAKTLKQIGVLRQAEDKREALLDSLDHEMRMVRLYALGAISDQVSKKTWEHPESLLPLLIAKREDQKADLEVRVRASSLVAQIRSENGLSKDDYRWLLDTLTNAEGITHDTMWIIADRLLKYRLAHRNTLSVLLKFLEAEEPDVAVMHVTMPLVTNPSIFNYENPLQDESRRVIDLLISCLRTDAKDAKLVAVRQLYQIARGIRDKTIRQSFVRMVTPHLERVRSSMEDEIASARVSALLAKIQQIK